MVDGIGAELVKFVYLVGGQMVGGNGSMVDGIGA